MKNISSSSLTITSKTLIAFNFSEKLRIYGTTSESVDAVISGLFVDGKIDKPIAMPDVVKGIKKALLVKNINIYYYDNNQPFIISRDLPVICEVYKS